MESAPAQAPPPPPYQPTQPPPQQQAPPPQQPQYPPPPPQYGQPGPPQYGQPGPPQYWQPQYPPQYWQPQGTQQYQMPGQPYPQNPYPPQYPPPPPPEQQYQPAPPPPPPPPDPMPQQQYVPPPPPPPPQYQPPVIADVRKAEPTPWPIPEEREGKPMWLVAVLTVAGVLGIFAIAYFLMGSHGSSAAKDAAAKDAQSNPLAKYIEVDGIRLVNQGSDVKFFVVNHGANDISDLGVKVTLWASTQRSEEDSVGSFTFHVDALAANDAKEMNASLKSDKQAFEEPEDWRNLTADVQITSGQ